MNEVPQWRHHEVMLLGALLGGPDGGSVDAYLDVVQVVHPRDMGDIRHEHILAAIYAQHDAHQPVNAISVADRLGKDLSRAGGHAYLAELTGRYVTSGNAGYWADKVRLDSMQRSMAEVGARLQQWAQADVEDMAQLQGLVDAGRAELDTVALRDTKGYDHQVAAFHALEALEQPGTAPVHTPWKALDAELGGWRRGALYYVGARPGVGKSILGLNAAVDMARRGGLAYVASMELTTQEMHHRMLSHIGAVDATYIQRRTPKLLEPDVWGRLSEASQEIQRLPMVLDDTSVQTVGTIRANLRALQRTHGVLGLVVVDYVQIMDAVKAKPNREQEVSSISRGLKVLAKDFDVPVLALSQLSRNGASGTPTMTDLRESGSLEQDGDVVMLLHVDEDDPDTLEVLVPKNRHGRAGGSAKLFYQPHYMRAQDRFGRNVA